VSGEPATIRDAPMTGRVSGAFATALVTPASAYVRLLSTDRQAVIRQPERGTSRLLTHGRASGIRQTDSDRRISQKTADERPRAARVSSFLSNERQAVIGQRERLLLPPLTHQRASGVRQTAQDRRIWQRFADERPRGDRL